MTRRRIGVVIPTLLAFEQCVKCLASVNTSCIWTPYIGRQWEENRAIAAVWNRCSKEAFGDGCDYVLILNDDVLLFAWTVDELVAYAVDNPDVHLVSGISTNNLDTENAASPLVTTNLNFSCFLITPQLFSLVGLFDENFWPAYFEDNDFHYRMQLLGHPACGISSAQFYHHHSFTSRAVRQGPDADAAHEAFRKCKLYYECKWGDEPGREIWTTPYNSPYMSPREWLKDGLAYSAPGMV